LRHLLLKSVELKLNNDEYADFKDVCKNIVKFSRMQNSFRFVKVFELFLKNQRLLTLETLNFYN